MTYLKTLLCISFVSIPVFGRVFPYFFIVVSLYVRSKCTRLRVILSLIDERSKRMKEIFEQYGGAIITVVVILALVSIISLLLQPDGVVYAALSKLVTDFANSAEKAAKIGAEVLIWMR